MLNPDPNHRGEDTMTNITICSVDGCVNPRHLRWDSRAGNLADRLTHGTDHRGEKAPWAKLTDSDILEIIALKGLLSQKEIALGFNVDPSHVSRIHAGMNRGGSYQRKIPQ